MEQEETGMEGLTVMGRGGRGKGEGRAVSSALRELGPYLFMPIVTVQDFISVLEKPPRPVALCIPTCYEMDLLARLHGTGFEGEGKGERLLRRV